MDIPKLSIIVISFNTRDITLECLRSVFREMARTSFELIVLDNASSDGSANAIQDEFGAKIKLIPSSVNYGFAVGNNIAAREAVGEFILLLNPDTVVLDGAIDKLVDFALARPEAGIWGGRTLFGDGSLNPASCWHKQTLWSLASQAVGLSSLFRKSTVFNVEGLGGWDRNGARYVDIVSGCFLLIKQDLWRRLDGFKEIFFMYGEEADLCLRAQNLGYRPLVSSVATIVHYGGASEKIKVDKMVRLLKAKSFLIQSHFPACVQWLGCRLLALWPLSRLAAFYVLSVVIGKHDYKEKTQIWRAIYARRREWDIDVSASELS